MRGIRNIFLKLKYEFEIEIEYMNYFLDGINFLHSDVSESESRSVVSNSLRPHGLFSPWNSPGQDTGVGSTPGDLQWDSPGDLPNPGIKPRSPTLQEDSLPAEPPGKPTYQTRVVI